VRDYRGLEGDTALTEINSQGVIKEKMGCLSNQPDHKTIDGVEYALTHRIGCSSDGTPWIECGFVAEGKEFISINKFEVKHYDSPCCVDEDTFHRAIVVAWRAWAKDKYPTTE
jgi:hypothetical protein